MDVRFSDPRGCRLAYALAVHGLSSLCRSCMQLPPPHPQRRTHQRITPYLTLVLRLAGY
jgi:hypothetical protein